MKYNFPDELWYQSKSDFARYDSHKNKFNTSIQDTGHFCSVLFSNIFRWMIQEWHINSITHMI